MFCRPCTGNQANQSPSIKGIQYSIVTAVALTAIAAIAFGALNNFGPVNILSAIQSEQLFLTGVSALVVETTILSMLAIVRSGKKIDSQRPQTEKPNDEPSTTEFAATSTHLSKNMYFEDDSCFLYGVTADGKKFEGVTDHGQKESVRDVTPWINSRLQRTVWFPNATKLIYEGTDDHYGWSCTVRHGGGYIEEYLFDTEKEAMAKAATFTDYSNVHDKLAEDAIADGKKPMISEEQPFPILPFKPAGTTVPCLILATEHNGETLYIARPADHWGEIIGELKNKGISIPEDLGVRLEAAKN